jgi:hypothetical protein
MFCSVSLYPSRYLSVFNLLENLKQEGLQVTRGLDRCRINNLY